MRITSLEVCSDPSGIKSLEVTLSNDEDTWVMDTIGGKTSDCRVIEDIPYIKKIRAASNRRGSGVNYFWKKSNGQKYTFGTIPDEEETVREWKFEQE